jgi:ATP-dependent DNA helicase PIF1
MNEGQKAAYNAVLGGHNVFLTGPGGTGKSYVLDQIFKDYTMHTGKRIVLTAMTGCAALLLGNKAKTLHSWASIGLGKDPPNVLIQNIRKSSTGALKRWIGTDCLVIDEISMMTPELLETLDEIGKKIRKSDKWFGGMQVVFVGDFYQLPPIYRDSETRFAFESPIWPKVVQKLCELKENMRQADPVFQKILLEARVGELSEESIKLLEARRELHWNKLTIRPTLLFSRKADVDHVNRANLKKLQGPLKKYCAKTEFQPIAATRGLSEDNPQVAAAVLKLDRDATYSAELELAVGAQVMLLWNMDQNAGLVNGSRGVVVGFQGDKPQVKFLNGAIELIEPHSWECETMEGVMRRQIPLALGYAITIHKAQGATLDSALIDVGVTTFECGQAYVALSRVKSLDSLYIWSFDPAAFKVHEKVRGFYS